MHLFYKCISMLSNKINILYLLVYIFNVKISKKKYIYVHLRYTLIYNTCNKTLFREVVRICIAYIARFC